MNWTEKKLWIVFYALGCVLEDFVNWKALTLGSSITKEEIEQLEKEVEAAARAMRKAVPG